MWQGMIIWILETLALIDLKRNREMGLISKHCCSCVQGFPSWFTPRITVTALMKLRNNSLVSLLQLFQNSFFPVSCFSKCIHSCWYWCSLLKSDECRKEMGCLCVFHVTCSYEHGQTISQLLFLENKNSPFN